MRKKDKGIIIETVTVGSHMKVTAIDSATGIEATIVADPKLSKSHLEKAAIKKLEYVMKKKKS